jgi:hypothetical protein
MKSYNKTYRGYSVKWTKDSNSVSVSCWSDGRKFTASAGCFRDSGALSDGDGEWVVVSRYTRERLYELIEHVERVGLSTYSDLARQRMGDDQWDLDPLFDDVEKGRNDIPLLSDDFDLL